MEPQNEKAMVLSTDTAPAALNLFSIDMFREAWKVAEQLAKSKLIPQNFQNNPPDCIIAMEMAQRIGASIFSVMQSLYIVHGRPGWSAQFIIAALNSCGRFSPLRFDIIGEGDERTCTAWALEKGTDEKLSGPPVSIGMAKAEGWYSKNGSKWQTMPELMLRYRAATFFGRLYAPDVLMGMRTAEELADIEQGPEPGPSSAVIEDLNARFAPKETIDESTGEIVAPPESKPTPPKATEPKDGKKADDKTQAAPPEEPKQEPESTELSPKVKAFMKEINQATTGGSVAVDTWRMKHHNRVANTCGGPMSPEAIAVMEYAEMTYRALVESEGEQGQQKQAG